MVANSKNLVSAIHQTHDLLRRCEDKMFSKERLTTEQYLVLVAVEEIGEHARVTDVANATIRSVNSVSMIVDRMVKGGLIKRVRDRRDRRTVFITITAKAEAKLKPATSLEEEFTKRVLSELSHEDKHILLGELLKIQHAASEYPNCYSPPTRKGGKREKELA